MSDNDTTEKMGELKEMSKAIETLIDVHIQAIQQSKDMLAAIDNLIEQNDILIVELTDLKKEREEDDGYVTLLDGQKLQVK